MLATSTHDTKRSGDVRSRLALLSEIPAKWARAVERWFAHNARHRRDAFPDSNTEYLFYQTAFGAWPLGAERAVPCMQKAVREAKVHTSWVSQNREYEDALKGFIEDVLADEEFTADLASFVRPLEEPGRINSLAQTLLKLTAPGVPDIYQGSELWDLSLVDPDNRRPVDYVLRRRLMSELSEMSLVEIWRRIDEGLPKMWVIKQALALRRRRADVFGSDSSYIALSAHGARADHVVAFRRGVAAITIVPRLVLTLGGEWRDTTLNLPSGRWYNELTGDQLKGGTVKLQDVLKAFPVALLTTSGTVSENA